MRIRRSRLLAAAAALSVSIGGGVATAAPSTESPTGEFAPLDQHGPRLSVDKDQLDASLECNGSLRELTRDPVLLVPGTTLTPEVNFGWNYMRAFDQLGLRWCAVTLPSDATGDIQVAGEYVVHALRTMSKESRRDVDVVGYSQGGMVPRWALRYWPDTRELVDDVIGLSPSNHGTVVADVACQESCTPANHQQASLSRFMQALNSGAESFPGIDYTVAYTATDEIVVPNTPPNASSALRTGQGRIANIALQEICPTNTADHFAIGSYDPVGYAIVVDALAYDGPAERSRIPLTVCAQLHQPGVDPATFAQDYTAMVTYAGSSEGDAADTPQEPPLAPYVFPRQP
ncbi:lipase family alpha/beta hydrolase [Blastococcus saxobsidens]|uniref:Lipase B n=1 Tax=Blastococcus saxobsidens (strain DD2) TaxID=1146883 RepID=H6RV85_BLASD|nr:lipase [Blastococcus saxobsidens]CCG01962.1 Lipase B [Blastococcus saxobsidens DD2]